MRKLLLLIALLGISTTYAQTFADYINAHRETTFQIPEASIYHTHTVYLHDHEKMVIEMTDITDYTMLSDIDSILREALADAAFYKDSFTELQNVRIDYDIKLGSDNTIMRFKKYNPDGDIYVKQNGKMARMKIARDTFRIIFRKPLHDHSSKMYLYDYPVQVTFLMNNYNNLYTLLQDKGMLKHTIDTLAKATLPEIYSPRLSHHRTEVEYMPYTAYKTMTVKREDTPPVVSKWESKFMKKYLDHPATKTDTTHTQKQ